MDIENTVKKLGNLILFNQTGEILFMSGELEGDVQRPDILNVDFIEIPFGELDYSKVTIESIDVVTKKPVLRELEINLTYEQEQIQKLEQEKADLVYKLMLGGN